MNKTLLELEQELIKFNNPESRVIPADILELLDNNPDHYCIWDLTEEERDEQFGYDCLCEKCLKEELEDYTCWDPIDLGRFYNSAYINKGGRI